MTEDNIHDTSILLSIAESVASIRDPELKRGLAAMLVREDSIDPTMITAPKWAKEMFARLFA